VVVGPDSGYGVSSKSISSNDWGGPVSGDISNIGFDMFGFDLSMLLGTSPVSITVDTNNASYSFNNQSALLAQGSTFFFGFSTNGAGEYFKSFSIASASNAVPAIDNVTLGHVAAVPEPTSISLLILGLALLWSAARFRSNSI
jgi:hypothetical protein